MLEFMNKYYNESLELVADGHIVRGALRLAGYNLTFMSLGYVSVKLIRKIFSI